MTRATELPGRRGPRLRSVAKLSLLAVPLVALVACWAAWNTRDSRQASTPVRGAPLTDAELRGKALFLRGVTAAGAPVTGRLATGDVELSGDLVACGRCHGSRGKGTGEGSVVVPNIQASRLFAPVSTQGPETGLAERPAYDDHSLADAIRRGISASGRELGPVMPRFELSEAELADLIAYLHRLGDDRDPGVFEDRLVLGAALPLTGERASEGEDVRAVLSAAFAEVNAQGGLFGRQLELRVEDDARTAQGLDGTERLLKAGVFALVGSLRTGPRESDARLEAEEVPLVAPIGVSDGHAEDEGRRIFYVYPGPELQARVAVQHLHAGWSRRRAEPVLAVLHASDEAGEAWARGARTEALRREWPAPKELAHPPGQLDPVAASNWLERVHADAVLFSGTPQELSALLSARGSTSARLPIYSPGSLALATVESPPSGWEQVAFVQSEPAEGLGSTAQEFESFLRRHTLLPRHLDAQRSAYASARLLVEALRRSGADLDRAGLVSALESFQDVDTGVTWPVSFGSRGRVGIRGGFVVRRDPHSRALAPLSDWIALSP